VSPTDELTDQLAALASVPPFQDLDPKTLLNAHSTQRLRRLAAVVSVVALALLGGGLATAGDGKGADSVNGWTDAPGKVRPEGPYGLFNAYMTPEERLVIRKGPISRADYQRFVQKSVDCLRAKGFTTRGPYWENDRLSYNYGYSTPPAAGERDFRKVAKKVSQRWAFECGGLSNSVSTAWQVDHGLLRYPPLEARIAEMRRGELGGG
jgi:hypothetical protein